MQKPSTIHFVGAGPGDPELITVKGMKLLSEADIIVYAGSLVEEKVLKYCKSGAAAMSSASMCLEEFMDVMVKGASEGKKVVRLHTGDPTLYSALREQADILEKEGIPYEVVPGVSSAFASAAAIKKELTSPEVTQTVIFTRLEGRTPVPKAESLSSLASHNATICVFLSVNMIDRVVSELTEGGYAKDTPVAVVYRATWDDEMSVRGTLNDIAGKVKAAGLTKHAMIIVGRSIGEGPSEAQSKLYDKAFSHGLR